jgi:hypothetical protein
MKRKFFSAILAATAFIFTAGFIGCSDDKGDDSPSVLLACNIAEIGMCNEYIKFKNEAEKTEAREDCEYFGGTIVSKCRDGAKLECPDDGDGIKSFVYSGMLWEAAQEAYGRNLRCSDDIYDLIEWEDD